MSAKAGRERATTSFLMRRAEVQRVTLLADTPIRPHADPALYASPFSFRICSAFVLSILIVGNVIFFSTFSPFMIFNP
jgi:hypothetical protein